MSKLVCVYGGNGFVYRRPELVGSRVPSVGFDRALMDKSAPESRCMANDRPNAVKLDDQCVAVVE